MPTSLPERPHPDEGRRHALRYAPLTRTLPRFAAEGGLSGFLAMAVILLASPAGSQSSRLGRVILLGGSAGLGAAAGAALAVLYWWWGRVDYKKSGGPITPPRGEDE